VLNAMRKVYVASGTDIPSNLDSLVNENPDVDPSAGTGVEVTYTSKTADSSEVGTLRINLTNANKDLSKYVGLEVRMKGAVASAGPAANGENEFGWASMDIFMMCGGGWTWFDANLMEQADVELSASEFKTFQVKFDTDFRTVPTAEDLKATNAIGINLYGPQVSGKVIFDYIAGVKADGSIEIIDGFEKKPSTESTASGKIVAIEGSTSIVKVAAFTRGLKAVSDYGMLKVSFVGSRAARGSVKLMNSMGQIVAQENFVVSQGVNSINLNTNYRGAGYLIVKNGGQVQSMKVMLK
ncbi:MAG: glycoside hydrolase family 5 protein, partial [Fibrobacteraceae bacterium]|nr:glycoside hydrolase family 5 protein [Fibrobacteraceae bacterium]